jgi:threonine aldolase
MLEAMMNARVGDDVFGDDPTVIELEEKASNMFGMEAGIFCPSGTMTNQIAIRIWAGRGDEVICDRTAHIYNYEGGGIAANAGASVRLLNGDRGRFTAADVVANINPDDPHYPITRLVSIENTANRGGGSCFTLAAMKEISAACREHGLKGHLDGARIFNALVATGTPIHDLHGMFDSISICLSKGLGAPVGSLLLGSADFIKRARRMRKLMGGGMRQAGFLAAAGIYALDNHVERLAEDHRRAKAIEQALRELPFVKDLLPVETNIVIFQLQDGWTAKAFVETLSRQDIKAVTVSPQSVRFVTHLDFGDEMLEKLIQLLKPMR